MLQILFQVFAILSSGWNYWNFCQIFTDRYSDQFLFFILAVFLCVLLVVFYVSWLCCLLRFVNLFFFYQVNISECLGLGEDKTCIIRHEDRHWSYSAFRSATFLIRPITFLMDWVFTVFARGDGNLELAGDKCGMCAPRYKYLVVLSLRDDASNTLMEHSESVPHSKLSFPSGVGIRKQPNIYQASRTIKTDCCRKC